MRTILTITFYLLTSITVAQSVSHDTIDYKERFKNLVLGKYNIEINNTNESIIYNSIIPLCDIDNSDSSIKATKLMWALYFYDTTKYSVSFFKPLLNRIVKSKKDYYTTNIEGEWRFRQNLFSGLGLMNSLENPSDTLNTINFYNGTAEFNFNNFSTRRTKYEITTEISGFSLSFNVHFDIHFFDNDEHWTFAINQINKDEFKLTRILEPNCACGCGFKIYFKKTNNDFTAK